MYLMLTDETNKSPGKDISFFIFGGLIIPMNLIDDIHQAIFKIRKKSGYKPEDELKFDTRSRPDNITIEQATEAKRQVIEVCNNFNCTFIVHIIHHEIIKNQPPDKQVQWAADYVIGRFNYFLTLFHDSGFCIIDNLPEGNQWQYLSEKFSKGLTLPDGSTKLKNIKLFASTCSNASHLSSAMDIVLGAFRYCINNPKNSDAASEMMQNVAKLMWHKIEGEYISFKDRGLIIRPKYKWINEPLKIEYNAMLKQLEDLIYK